MVSIRILSEVFQEEFLASASLAIAYCVSIRILSEVFQEGVSVVKDGTIKGCFNPYSIGSLSGRHLSDARAFSIWQVSIRILSEVFQEGNHYGLINLRGLLFQSVFYRKSFRKGGILLLAETCGCSRFNPYSIGSLSERQVIVYVRVEERRFQSVFYRKSFRKAGRFPLPSGPQLVSIRILSEVFQKVYCPLSKQISRA